MQPSEARVRISSELIVAAIGISVATWAAFMTIRFITGVMTALSEVSF